MKTYLALGHVTRDLTPDGEHVGGTALYAAQAARALGYRVRMVTSMPPPIPTVPGIEVENISSTAMTTFEFSWTGDARAQRLTALAPPIHSHQIPALWLTSDIVHLGPVAAELDESMAKSIPASSFLGVTPQGWMRSVGSDGTVGKGAWHGPRALIKRADAIVLSRLDLAQPEVSAARWADLGSIVAVTNGGLGSVIFAGHRTFEVPAYAVNGIVSDLGAGDVFAACFFARLAEGSPPDQAGRFASAAGGLSLLHHGPGHSPTRTQIEELLGSAS